MPGALCKLTSACEKLTHFKSDTMHMELILLSAYVTYQRQQAKQGQFEHARGATRSTDCIISGDLARHIEPSKGTVEAVEQLPICGVEASIHSDDEES